MKQKGRLRNLAAKYKQVINNMVDFQMTKFNNINFPIKKLDNKMVRIFIIGMKVKNGEKVFLEIEKFQ